MPKDWDREAKWGTGPDIPKTAEMRSFYRGVYRVGLLGIVALFILGVASGTPWHTIAGCMMIGFTIGKWAAPEIQRLDTDRYPYGREFEHATRSLSPDHGAAYLGISRPVYPRI